MAVRTSEAVWEGDLKKGHGTMKVGQNAYEGPYSFASRFENGKGTNPEELLAAGRMRDVFRWPFPQPWKKLAMYPSVSTRPPTYHWKKSWMVLQF